MSVGVGETADNYARRHVPQPRPRLSSARDTSQRSALTKAGSQSEASGTTARRATSVAPTTTPKRSAAAGDRLQGQCWCLPIDNRSWDTVLWATQLDTHESRHRATRTETRQRNRTANEDVYASVNDHGADQALGRDKPYISIVLPWRSPPLTRGDHARVYPPQALGGCTEVALVSKRGGGDGARATRE